MIHYLLISGADRVVQRGICPTEAQIPNIDGLRAEVVAPDDPRQPANEPAPKSYQELRQAAYPSMGDQLDMFWHAMNNGQIPRIEPFYSEIKGVKDQFPKA